MREYRGIAASPGVAAAPAFIYREEELAVPDYSIPADKLDSEWKRFEKAVAQSSEEVKALRDRARETAGKDQAAIFDAHLLMLNDPELSEGIQKRLRENHRNIESVIVDFERELVEKMGGIEDPYLQTRTADIHDVSRRILAHLSPTAKQDLSAIDSDVILVASDLVPSDLLTIRRDRVKAIVTEAGGRTSHAAILARAFEIPAVLGVRGLLSELSPGEPLVVDGTSGLLVASPDAKTLEAAASEQSAAHEREARLGALRDLPAETADGERVALKANIEVPEEAEAALAHGAEGIGLFRSEFLFFQPGHVPGEEGQFEAYKRVVEAMKGRPVTIRTLDIGGDKVLPELGAANEKNPLLGWRAIRFCLAKEDIFLAQLRAILRAAAFGDVRIMFPMISGPSELERARALLEEAHGECRRRGQKVPDRIKVGIMIEVPSAALTSDILARNADFFSIGTNDLIQYTVAVDRGNEKVAYLYRPFHPAVIRLIKMTIDNGAAAGIPVGMCGEMASDPAAALLLLGLGLKEFSMSSASLLPVKSIIRSVKMADAREAAQKALGMSTAAEISEYLAARTAAIVPGRSGGHLGI